MTSQGKNPRLRYCVILAIKHPSINPISITIKLKIKPSNTWMADAERTTIIGTPLPGTNKYSFWTANKKVIGNRLFSRGLLQIIEILEGSREYILNIIDTGGRVFITIQLPGDVNIGDNLDLALLERIVALKVNIGIEVFPKFN